MATTNLYTQCSICQQETSTFLCNGCSNNFCFHHLTEHRQLLNEQFHQIQDDFNQFKQLVIEIKENPLKHPLINQIDQWENNSIQKIKQRAKKCRYILMNYTNLTINQIEMKLNNSNEQLINDFNEIYLNKLKEKLKELKEEVNEPRNVSIKQKSNSFINQIFIQFKQLVIPNLNINQTWKQHATTVAGGHGQGNGLNQLNNPHSLFIHHDQTIYVADYSNHRIVEWKRNAFNGKIVAGRNDRGNRNDQLSNPMKVIVDKENDSLIICDSSNRRVVRWPRQYGQSGEILISNIYCQDLIMDNDGYLYILYPEKHEVRRSKIGETNERIVAGGNRQGNRLNQLNYPMHIFIDEDHSVYVSDYYNHRVMKWMEGAREGIVVAGGQGQGNSLRQLSHPMGIIVDQLGSIYVADYNNHRVIRWLKGAQEGTIVVGGNGEGQQPNQFNFPVDLSFDRENNLYVVDLENHRVQKFEVN